ncbi:MAG: hypothetical protein ACWA47_12640 [Brevirhabdus sp.]
MRPLRTAIALLALTALPAVAAPGSAQMVAFLEGACLVEGKSLAQRVAYLEQNGLSRFGANRNKDLSRKGGNPTGRFTLRSSDRLALVELGNLVGGGKSCKLVGPASMEWDAFVALAARAVKNTGSASLSTRKLSKSEYRIDFDGGRLFVRKQARAGRAPDFHLTWSGR